MSKKKKLRHRDATPNPPGATVRGTRARITNFTIPGWPDFLLLAGFLSSGVAALGLELIWIRVLGIAFGSETFGMLGVLTGFFAGLALGAALLHRVILRSRRPVRFYVAAEIVIAAYALLLPVSLLPLAELAPQFIGPYVGDNRSLLALSLNLVVAMLILLPATFCMGATTVSVVEAWRRRRTKADNTNTVAWLYAVNTAGAAIGLLLCTYWLLPAVGVSAASGVLAVFSLMAALLAWCWERARADGVNSAPVPDAVTTPRSAQATGELTAAAVPRSVLYALLFGTGLAGIGLETIGTHVLAQVFENTVHTFANILAIYLFGTALGAWLYASISGATGVAGRERTTRLLLYGLALTGLMAAVALAQTASMMSVLAPDGSSYGRRMIAEAVVSAIVFLPATAMMGATFSHLVGHFTYDGVGYASAFNTLGAALAPFLFGLVLLPSLGYGAAFYAAVGLYVLLFVAAALRNAEPIGRILVGVGVVAVALVLTASSLVLVEFPASVNLLAQRVGLQGVVSVTELPGSAGSTAPRILQVDQRQLMGGSPGLVTQRMGHLPMLVYPTPQQVLYLGVGTGITAGAALEYPINRVTAVELLPEILHMLPWFKDFNGDLGNDRRVDLHASDARRFVRATSATYDVVVADLYHPSRDGTGSLYTVEHFENIRSRLREGGLFVQWLPLHQLRPQDLRTIVRTFLRVFPQADSMLGNYSGQARFALLGWNTRGGRGSAHTGVDVPRAEALLRGRKRSDPVFDGVRDLLASYMLDADALARYAGAGALNTDVNQRIIFDSAEAVRMEDGAETYRTLATLLPYRHPFPESFVQPMGAGQLPALRDDVRPFADAVSHYLAGEVIRGETPPGSLPTAAVAEYLNAYGADIRFTLAVGKLLEIAVQYPGTAKDIVHRVRERQPGQTDIDRLHRRLQGVDAPDQVRSLVSTFLRTGGE